MAITLVEGSNTYTTLAEAEAYFTKYGNEEWTAITDDELKKQALVLGTQSVDLLYGGKYVSMIAVSTQELLFPRIAFYDNDGRYTTGIPTCLKNAVSELALMYINGADIFPIANTDTNVRSSTIQVGGITISTENYKANESEAFTGFRKIDILLRPVLTQAQTNWRIKA